MSYDKRSYVAPLPVPAQRSRPGPVYNRPMRKPQSVIQQELRQSDAEHKANVRSNRGKYTSRETQIKNLQNSTYQKGKKKVAPKKLRQQPANENVYRPEEVRFAEVNDQINERRAYIDEMRYLGELSPEDERRLNGEIADVTYIHILSFYFFLSVLTHIIHFLSFLNNPDVYMILCMCIILQRVSELNRLHVQLRN